jgi:hypothetical protein
MADQDNYSGVQKAAILLITLGPEKAAAIFKHLKEEEIEELTLEIANTRSVSPQTKEDILNEFYQVCLAQQYIAEGGIGYAKELLEKALGEDKAQNVIAKLTASLQVRPFEFAQDRAEPVVELYSGRASADHRDDSVIPAKRAGIYGARRTSAGKAGGCRKAYRYDGPHIPGCYQGGRACVGA